MDSCFSNARRNAQPIAMSRRHVTERRRLVVDLRRQSFGARREHLIGLFRRLCQTAITGRQTTRQPPGNHQTRSRQRRWRATDIASSRLPAADRCRLYAFFLNQSTDRFSASASGILEKNCPLVRRATEAAPLSVCLSRYSLLGRAWCLKSWDLSNRPGLDLVMNRL